MQVDETLVHTKNDDADRKALEAFVVDNQELERLEDLLIQFNIFEAIGAVWQELRHSARVCQRCGSIWAWARDRRSSPRSCGARAGS